MKLVSSLFAAAAVFCAGVVTLNPAVAQQDPPAQQKQKDGASVASPNETNQRTFVPGNFRLQLEGENEGVVEGVEEKQSVARDDIGAARDYERSPAPAPPRVTVTWGGQHSPVPSVVDSIATKYTMFHTDGAPARATTGVELSEAEDAKQKQRPSEDDDNEDDE